MKMRLLPILLILLAAILFACELRSSKQSHTYVNDHAFLLTNEQEATLTAELKELETSVGSQMVILIVDSLGGQRIEAYSLHIVNDWGIGRKNYDDGVLILIAVQERQIRIEVGYGLERIIKDEIAARIIRDDMAPYFRDENYYEGLLLAVQKINTMIKENSELVGQRP